jgi:hypothetical protein
MSQRRLELYIQTQNPNALPGQDAFKSDNALRVGASRDFFENWDTSVGIKTKWLPEPLACVQ